MSTDSRIGFLQILNIIAFAAVVIINGLADFLPINGQTTGAIAGQYPNLFTPAAVTFSIWAVIYSLLLLFSIYQGSTLFETEKRKLDKKEKVVDKIGMLFILSCALNIAWIFAWHFNALWLSVLVMLGLLITLSKIFVRIHNAALYNGKSKWFVYVPFSVYLGWISIATIANITTWLVGIQWDAFGIDPSIWTSIMIILGTALGAIMLLKKNNMYFSLVIIWALAGILLKQHKLFSNISIISVTAMSGIALLLILIVWNKKHATRTLASPSEGQTT